MVLQRYKIKLHSNSTFLERNLVTVGVLQGVTSVTKSLDLLKIFFLNKNTFIIKTGTNEKKKVTI